MFRINGAMSILMEGYGVKLTIFLITSPSVKMSRWPLVRTD